MKPTRRDWLGRVLGFLGLAGAGGAEAAGAGPAGPVYQPPPADDLAVPGGIIRAVTYTYDGGAGSFTVWHAGDQLPPQPKGASGAPPSVSIVFYDLPGSQAQHSI